MKSFARGLLASALLALALVTNPAFAEQPAVDDGQPAGSGETLIRLDVGFGIRAVPPSRVSVPVGETLRIAAPDLGDGTRYEWTKDGRGLAGASGSTLTLNHVVSTDAGTYVCRFVGADGLQRPSQTLVLGVGPTDRLINLSTRASIGGADQGLVSGFVVGANAAGKKLILRAVGPSLSLFGVTDALRTPVLRVFDASGKPYENAYVYPAVVGGPTYETDLAASLARTGAFPLPAGSRDAVMMKPFVPGSYTVQVTSGDGSAGVVLLEVYEVP